MRGTPRRGAPLGRRELFFSILLPAAVSAAAALVVFRLLVADLVARRSNQIEWIQDAMTIVAERYIDPVDPDELAFDAIRAVVHRDPYSDFIPPDLEERFREENEGRYVGIGILVDTSAPPITVLYAFPGSPAERAGLQPGDRIVAVDGEPIEGLSLADAVSRIKIRNGEGKAVRLRIRPWAPPDGPAPPEREVQVVRSTILRPSVYDPRILDREAGVAYVRISQFQGGTSEELEEALEDLRRRGMRSLVLDLRGNRGGLLEEAVKVVSLFLGEGVVVRTIGRTAQANEVYEVPPRAAPFAGLPLVLLVDDETASASEIVAGALQDHFRAVLLGDRTFGKGMVQSVIERRYVVDGEERSARIKITTSRYFTPGGRCIEWRRRLDDDDRGRSFDRGLHPDVFFPIVDPEERRLLRDYLTDREIPDDVWALIEQRCPDEPHVVEGKDGFRDRQTRRAVQWLAGGLALSVLGRR